MVQYNNNKRFGFEFSWSRERNCGLDHRSSYFQYRRQSGKRASAPLVVHANKTGDSGDLLLGSRVRQPASALGNRVLKSSKPTHSGVTVIRTIAETMPRN